MKMLVTKYVCAQKTDSPLRVFVGNHLVLLHLLVQLTLQSAHPDLDYLLNLVWQFVLDIFFSLLDEKGRNTLFNGRRMSRTSSFIRSCHRYEVGEDGEI